MSQLPHTLQTVPYIGISYCEGNNTGQLYSILTNNEYEVSREIIEVLDYSSVPRNINDILFKFKRELVEECVDKGYLADPLTIWKEVNVENIAVEVNTHCNWRCEYCPVSTDPKPKEIISMDLFDEIIEKAVRSHTVKTITLSFFNEPTLDPYLEERVSRVGQTNLKLDLSTNGSRLDDRKIKLLKNSKNLSLLRFNLPSVKEEMFKKMTDSSLFEQTISNITNAIENGLPVQFVVNGTHKEISENIIAIKAKFPMIDDKNILYSGTNDRAGLVKNKYYWNLCLKGALSACLQVTNWIHIAVNGDYFLCSMDYYQKNVYGNIKESELQNIIESSKAQLIRKYVFGEEQAPQDYICRKCLDMKRANIFFSKYKSFRQKCTYTI